MASKEVHETMLVGFTGTHRRTSEISTGVPQKEDWDYRQQKWNHFCSYQPREICGKINLQKDELFLSSNL